MFRNGNLISSQDGPLSVWAGSNFWHLCAFYCLYPQGTELLLMRKTAFPDLGCRSSKLLRSGGPLPSQDQGRQTLGSPTCAQGVQPGKAQDGCPV